MGRPRVEVRFLNPKARRLAMYRSRSIGLLKDANELHILCDATVRLQIMSKEGQKNYQYYSEGTSQVRNCPHCPGDNILAQPQFPSQGYNESLHTLTSQVSALCESAEEVSKEYEAFKETSQKQLEAKDEEINLLRMESQSHKNEAFRLSEVNTGLQQLVKSKEDLLAQRTAECQKLQYQVSVLKQVAKKVLDGT